jgi:hypothetical protein
MRAQIRIKRAPGGRVRKGSVSKGKTPQRLSDKEDPGQRRAKGLSPGPGSQGSRARLARLFPRPARFSVRLVFGLPSRSLTRVRHARSELPPRNALPSLKGFVRHTAFWL